MDNKVLNSKTIIGVGLIISGVWIFSGGISNKLAERNYIKSKNYISNIIKDARNEKKI